MPAIVFDDLVAPPMGAAWPLVHGYDSFAKAEETQDGYWETSIPATGGRRRWHLSMRMTRAKGRDLLTFLREKEAGATAFTFTDPDDGNVYDVRLDPRRSYDVSWTRVNTATADVYLVEDK